MNPIPERNPGGIAPLAHRGEPRVVSEEYYQDTGSLPTVLSLLLA